MGDPWVLARELAFELVRASDFPNRPSRLSGIFCFDDAHRALDFFERRKPMGILYRVELVDPTLPTLRSNMQLVDFFDPGIEFLYPTMSQARSYWTGENTENAEILTESPLRVLEIVASGAAAYQPLARR